MPQELHVLRCFNCKTFQVQIVKKTNKWQCKMCNEKQSVKKVYIQGTGKDCRLHVQALNTRRMELDEGENELNISQASVEVHTVISEPQSSKWDEFLTKQTQSVDEDIDEAYTFERPNKKNRLQNQNAINCKRSKQSTSSNSEVVNEINTKQLINATNEDEAVEQAIITDINNVGDTKSKWGAYLTEETPLGENSFGVNVKKASKWGEFIQETKDIDENTVTENIFCNTDTDLDDVLNF